MNPTTILIKMGRFSAKVPRKFLVEPSYTDKRIYDIAWGRVSMWRGSVSGITHLIKHTGIELSEYQVYSDKPMAAPNPTINMQLASDIAEASHVNIGR